MFEMSRMKIRRADALIIDYRNIADEFLKTNPYEVYISHDAHYTNVVGVVHALPPWEMSMILGDAIHNLRSALDILANDALCAEGKNANRGASFPIYKLEDKFEKALSKNMMGASEELRSIVRRWQPFNFDTSWIRRLHDIDIVDKHRSINSVVSNPYFHEIRGVHRGGGEITLGAIKLQADEIGRNVFLSVSRGMRFKFSNSKSRYFFFSPNQELADEGVSTESAFNAMREDVLKIIGDFEDVYLER